MPCRCIAALLCTFLLAAGAAAQWRSVGDVSTIREIPNGVELSAPPFLVAVTAVSDNVIRVRMSPAGSFLPDSSWAVVGSVSEPAKYEIRETPATVFLSTPSVEVRIDRTPCRIGFYSHGRLINADDPARGMAAAGSQVAVWKTMPENEEYYGFGERSGALHRKWTAMSNWNTDIPAYTALTDPLYQSIPFFYGIRDSAAYGIFLDNSYYSFFNMGKEDPTVYSFGAAGGELNYYFIYGPTPKEVMAAYARLTGTMPLPPKWAVGYQQCRWSYFPDAKVREIASNFRTKRIPCDVIYLDIDYMDGYRCFTWNTERFPRPKGLASDLARDGFKIVTIIDPGIKIDSGYAVYRSGLAGGHFIGKPDGTLFEGDVWPGRCVFPDFTSSGTRLWWGGLLPALTDSGIRGFWNDMNEPSVFNVRSKTVDLDALHDDRGLKTDHRKNHNVYGMQMARATHEGAIALRPGERPFVLTRANFAGGQRYAAAWTGDNVARWDNLEMAVPMCLNLSISGQPFVGSDIGGFIDSPTPELYARWLQLGVFTPLMRTHTAWDTKPQEPWSYGPAFEAINKRTIELRYRFLPYIYTQFYLASSTGIPMMRPIFFEYPSDRWTYGQQHEFFFGDDLLVAPVVRPDDRSRRLRLPVGTWVDFWSDSVYTGGHDVTVDAPIERLPLFVRPGSILPTQTVVQYTDERPIDTLTLDIYPSDAGASGTMYEDDGISFGYREGSSLLRTFTFSRTGSAYALKISGTGAYRPPPRVLTIRIHRISERPASIALNGRSLQGWRFDGQTGTVTLSVPDPLGSRR